MTIDFVDNTEKAPANNNIISFRFTQAAAKEKASIEEQAKIEEPPRPEEEQTEVKEQARVEETAVEEEKEEVKSINSESSFDSWSEAFGNLNSEAINELAAKATNMAVYDKYKGKINKVIKKYHSDFLSFFRTDCKDAATSYINNLPKERYVSLDCHLTDAKGQNSLEFSRVNPILQNPSNNATVDYIINLSIKLKLASIRAVYTGEREDATYEDCGGKTGNWVFSCKEKSASASYLVKIFYELPKASISVPLMSLKFASQAPTSCYQIRGKSIYDHANSVRDNNKKINSMPLEVFLKDFWSGSKLVDNSIVIQSISPNILSIIIEETAKCALASTAIEGKNFRKKLLENNRGSFSAALDKIDETFKLILKYARLAGVAEESIAEIQNPLLREQFYQDMVNLSLAEHAPDGSESLFQKYKKLIDDFEEKINKLLYPESGLEDSSDEEIEQTNNRLPQPRPRPLL